MELTSAQRDRACGVLLATAAGDALAGNGSLMRTAPVALAYLDDPDGLVEAAMAVSALTHFDQSAGHACVLWCLAIRHAVLTGELDREQGSSMCRLNSGASGPSG